MTDEIHPTLSREEYRTQLDTSIRATTNSIIADEEETAPYSTEELQSAVREYLVETDGLYLTHPISVIEHSEKSLSHRGASQLQDVISAEDFAQEHARDIFIQEITAALVRIQEGETIAGVRKSRSRKTGSGFSVTTDTAQASHNTSNNHGGHHE